MRRAVFLLGLVAACDGASADTGLAALMRIQGAQYFSGSPASHDNGPRVMALNNSRNVIHAGQRDKPLSGTLAEQATAVALFLEGDQGYWVLPAGLPDVQVPGLPTFTTKVSFSPDLPPGAYVLSAYASDDAGRFGPAVSAEVIGSTQEIPDGELVVSLAWDTQADLDLRVVDAHGVEIWRRNINSVEPPAPGIPPDPNAWRDGALLDFDSNGQCVIDGRRQENVIWSQPPAPGDYRVRVDTFSLCEAPGAYWRVDVFRAGEPIAAASGTSVEAQTRLDHGPGAGVLAAEFTIQP